MQRDAVMMVWAVVVGVVCWGVSLAGFVQAAEKGPVGENAITELELRGWAPSLRGSVQSSSANLIGSIVRADETLGMDTTRQFLWPKATLHFARNHRIWVSYLDMPFAGDKTLTQTITFAGKTFNVNQTIHSELDVKEIAGGYQYDWLKFSQFASHLNLQVHYLDFKAKLSSSVTGTVSERINVPVPTIGGGIQVWPVQWLKLHGEFNIFKLGMSGFKGELIDSQTALTLSPWEWVGASVGYRYYKIIARDTETNERFDWLQHGPYVSVMVRF
jgi:hypothetical protein